MIRIPRLTVVLILVSVIQLGCSRPHDVEVVSLPYENIGAEMPVLDDALENVQILLLGENGHGVKQFTQIKLDFVEWLHREHGFSLVVFESGLFECDWAYRNLEDLEAHAALKACLRYPFEHAELLPLFELAKATRESAHPLVFSGMDFQAQGFDSDRRPGASFDWLESADTELARRIAKSDSALYLVPQNGGLGDAAYEFVYRNSQRLKADYQQASTLTSGTPRLVFSLATGWVDRLAIRGEAVATGKRELPARYFELRDEWMARAVSALADSLGTERKVIVWLHNDHARYGRFPVSPSDSIRSTGSYLQEWYGDRVFSVGLFMGRGTVADNARRPRAMAPIPSDGLEAFLSRGPMTYTVLRSNPDTKLREWANAEQKYLRMGLDTLSLVPAHEFDALVYVDSVSVPDYQVP